MPRVPSGYGAAAQREEIDFEDKIVVEARTPSDFALHAIFIRFAARAEILVNIFVTQPPVSLIAVTVANSRLIKLSS